MPREQILASNHRDRIHISSSLEANVIELILTLNLHRRYRSDGSRFWANVVITPIYRGDVLLGFSKVTRDLTERRKAEKKLIDAYEEASRLKSEFLANM